MKHLLVAAFVAITASYGTAYTTDSSTTGSVRVLVPGDGLCSATLVAVDRLETYGKFDADLHTTTTLDAATTARLTILLGSSKDSDDLSSLWNTHPASKPDSYLLKTMTTTPLVIAASGIDSRGTLYAAYQLADLLRAKSDLSNLDIYRQPRISERYVSFGATTHGRRHYRPELYWKTLNELPAFGYNGVIIYPGGGTPIGRKVSPIAEREDGTLYLDPANTEQWKQWFREIEKYQLDIMMTIPPVIPPGYAVKDIKAFYAGGPEPEGYTAALKNHFRRYLELVTEAYPDSDLYMFNSTEGATFGRNVRFFGPPDFNRYTNRDYLRNNEKVMSAYFDVLTEFFKNDLKKVMFWTHSFGLTSDGIRKMREVLFQYPDITIIEDDFWNNNLWPHDLPAMAYLPEDLRAKVSRNNPFALFQIATDGEYYGGGSLPNAYPGSHIRSANEALDRGARMVIQRLDLHDRTEYGTAFGTVEIIPYAASKQLWEPTPSEKEIWHEWAESRFGKKAAPLVIKALQQSKVIMRQGLSGNGIDLLGVHSEFISRLWMKNHTGVTRYFLFGPPNRRLVKDDGDAITSEEFTAYQMNTQSLSMDEFRQNQDAAMKAVKRGLGYIEQAKPHLAEADYQMLNSIYQNAENVLTAMRLLGETAYATNLVSDNFDNVEDPHKLFNHSVRQLEQFLDRKLISTEMIENIQKTIAHYRELAGNQSAPQATEPVKQR